ncbi:MAG: Smr/MutS family protein, partial [Actinomycetia bacterium]|nr:Smr/MutS family protein [Actinomycetes bacterium]
MDLHGLSGRLAEEVVRRVVAGQGRLRLQQVRFIHGRGGRNVLKKVVNRVLADADGHISHGKGWKDLRWGTIRDPLALVPRDFPALTCPPRTLHRPKTQWPMEPTHFEDGPGEQEPFDMAPWVGAAV